LQKWNKRGDFSLQKISFAYEISYQLIKKDSFDADLLSNYILLNWHSDNDCRLRSWWDRE